MKKRTTALLTAATLLTTLCVTTSMQTSAEEALVLVRDSQGSISVVREEDESFTISNPSYDYIYDKVWQGEHGECMYHGQTTGTGFWYAVTTAEGMPRKYVLPGDTRPHYIEATELFPDDEEFPQGGLALLAAHGEGARLFKFQITGYTFSQDEYLLEQSCDDVLDVYLATFINDGTCVWDGTFITHLPITEELLEKYYDEETKRLSPELTETMVVENALGKENADMVDTLLAAREEWKKSYEAWRETVDVSTMTPAEREAALKEAGIMTDWEITKMAIDTAHKLDEFSKAYYEREGVPNAYIPTDIRFSMREVEHSYGYKDIWETMGDFNGDGYFDAADATYVLTAAAENGSGAEKITFADFNLDGDCNAADASNMLQFLAEKGAGSSQTVKNYIENLS